MKKLILGALLLLSTVSFGQDTIFLKKLMPVTGEIHSYNRYLVTIYVFDNPDDLIGVTREISTDLIDSVKFLNGKVFTNKNFTEYSDINDFSYITPGDEFQLYARHMHIGYALIATGTLVSTIGILSSNPNNSLIVVFLVSSFILF